MLTDAQPVWLRIVEVEVQGNTLSLLCLSDEPDPSEVPSLCLVPCT